MRKFMSRYRYKSSLVIRRTIRHSASRKVRLWARGQGMQTRLRGGLYIGSYRNNPKQLVARKNIPVAV